MSCRPLKTCVFMTVTCHLFSLAMTAVGECWKKYSLSAKIHVLHKCFAFVLIESKSCLYNLIITCLRNIRSLNFRRNDWDMGARKPLLTMLNPSFFCPALSVCQALCVFVKLCNKFRKEMALGFQEWRREFRGNAKTRPYT